MQGLWRKRRVGEEVSQTALPQSATNNLSSERISKSIEDIRGEYETRVFATLLGIGSVSVRYYALQTLRPTTLIYSSLALSPS